MNSEIRNCSNCHQNFVIEADDFWFYEKIGVPAPKLCPDCRRERRMAWRNDYNFYNRECGMCGRKIISIYSSDKSVPIYCNKCWWSDKWDPKIYGREAETSKSFFAQYRELLNSVPALAILNDNSIASVNCDYTNYFALGKDCYLTINSWKVENCHYCYYMVDAKDAVDITTAFANVRNTYDSIFLFDINSCRYVYNSKNLLDCALCYDCRNCENCFISIGLRNKKYHIKNHPYSKEEYERIMAGYKLDAWTGVQSAKKEFSEFIMDFPRRPANFNNCVNCTGNYLINSKNAVSCFNAVKVENSKFFENGDTIKDSYDCHSGGEQELCYEGINPDNSYGTHFTSYCHKDRNVLYSDSCQGSEELFGCVGLKNSKYCIFNKQYNKKDYLELKEKLVNSMKERGEWGEFFPINLSTFGYNETIAQESYPLTKEKALELGYKWQDKLQFTTGKETIKEAPDSINDVQDSILNEILRCSQCGRNYKIIEDELLFYRRNRIPIPRKCFLCRLKDRMEIRNPVKLWRRKCQCSGAKSENGVYANTIEHQHKDVHCLNEFETSYAPDRKEIVYCEQCYNAEVV